MYIFIWLASFVFFLLLLTFSAKNTDLVTVNYYFDFHWQVPLVVLFLIFLRWAHVLGIYPALLSICVKRLSELLAPMHE